MEREVTGEAAARACGGIAAAKRITKANAIANAGPDAGANDARRCGRGSEHRRGCEGMCSGWAVRVARAAGKGWAVGLARPDTGKRKAAPGKSLDGGGGVCEQAPSTR